MTKFKTPLWIQTIIYGYLFIAGAGDYYISEDLTLVFGFGIIATLIWMWRIVKTEGKTKK